MGGAFFMARSMHRYEQVQPERLGRHGADTPAAGQWLKLPTKVGAKCEVAVKRQSMLAMLEQECRQLCRLPAQRLHESPFPASYRSV